MKEIDNESERNKSTLYTNKNEVTIVLEKARTSTSYFKNVRYTDCVGLEKARTKKTTSQ